MTQTVAFERKSRNSKKIEQDEKELEELMNKVASPQEEPEKEEEEEQPEAEEAEQEEQPKEKEKAKKKEPEEEEEKLSGEEKSFKKRYGDLRRHMADKEKEYKERIEALEKRLNKESVVPPKSDEDLDAWAKKYPDVAGIVETIAKKKADEMVAGLEDKFREYDEMREETLRDRAYTRIREAHSDFDKLRDSDEFHDWAEKQPKWVSNALYENEDDADSVIRVIDLYKMDNNLTVRDKKKKDKEAATEVKARSTPSIDSKGGSKKIYESAVAKMSDKEYEENEENILEAMRSGNFVYDMSGGAR